MQEARNEATRVADSYGRLWVLVGIDPFYGSAETTPLELVLHRPQIHPPTHATFSSAHASFVRMGLSESCLAHATFSQHTQSFPPNHATFVGRSALGEAWLAKRMFSVSLGHIGPAWSKRFLSNLDW